MDKIGLLVADIYECAGLFRKQGEFTAGKAGQTQARWQVLSVASGGNFTVPQIARRLGITRQSVQRIVNDLFADNLISLKTNPDHQTSPIVMLLPDGEKTLKKITESAQAYHKELQASIGETDLERLSAVLQKVNMKLKEMG